MARLLTKNLTSMALSTPFSSSLSHKITLLIPLFRFSTQTLQKEDLPFMARYLISSFGFSEDRAIKVASSKNFLPIKTPDRPESVIRFLKDTGLTDVQIKKVVSSVPYVLSGNVSKTLEPAACKVIAAGFTLETLINLIQHNPVALNYTNLVSRLQFWKNFFGTDDEAFLKCIITPMMINTDLNREIIPRINLLKEYGLSDKEISILSLKSSYFFVQSHDCIRSNIEQLEKLGLSRGSKMFLVGLTVVSKLKKDTVDKKVSFFKTAYGWSQEDFNSAFRRHPALLSYSQEKVCSVMDFLIKKVGLNPWSVALHPGILGFSLERRLIPRHYVLSVLKSKGLEIKWSIFTLANRTENQFIEKCILPYKEEFPDLEEAYAATCAGKMIIS